MEKSKSTQLNALLDTLAPLVEQDGGELSLVSFDEGSNSVTLQLAGACGSCSITNTTEEGINRIFKERLPWLDSIKVNMVSSTAVGTGSWQPQ